MKETQITVPLKTDDRKMDLRVYLASNFVGYVEPNVGRRVDKREFLNYLHEHLGLSRYKCKTILEAYIVAGLVEEDKDGYLFIPADRYIVLDKETAKYCISALSQMAFTIYVYLLDKYQLHCKYNQQENWYFSIASICKALGYSFNQVNTRMQISNCLAVLKEIGLVEYSDERVTRYDGGQYFELYRVNMYSKAQVRAIEQNIGDANQHQLEIVEHEKKKQRMLGIYENNGLDIRRSDNYNDDEKALFQELVDEGKIIIRGL